MNSVFTIARKELRTWFQSPTALIFLGMFLLATSFSFFSYERFFARNLADLRPLFDWMPILLIFLVSAITMRQWAEEKKLGTVEVLFTLPLKTWQLVLGKFTAGMGLVAMALAMTFPLVVTVALLGDLDWGPVVGGYVGALLLAGAYMSIGLCISARTDNQVVALMTTLLVGGLLYLVGTDRMLSFVGNDVAEVLSAIGSGSRFESIERGVIDLRDLFYYASITGFFLVFNVYSLEVQRIDSGSKSGGLRYRAWQLATVLVGLNVIVGNTWLAPVGALRADLTERGEYSISGVTIDTLGSLEEPLQITGYFSERTHPLLAPLIPQIKDLLVEYRIRGKGKVRLDFVDPNKDEEIENEIAEAYGIRSVPFAVSDRNQQSVLNSFFHVLVQYGDEYEVLSFDQLIEVRSDSDQEMEIRLRNLEYDVTKTIRKVTQSFDSLEAILAKMGKEPAKLTAYVTPEQLPEEYGETVEAMRKAIKTVEKNGRGQITVTEVDPSKDQALMQELYDKYSLQPLAADLFGTKRFYMHIVIEVGGKVEPMIIRGNLTEADIERGIEASIKRLVPGQLKTVGIYTETPAAPPPNPQLPPQMQPPPPQPDFRGLQQFLSQEYEVQRVDLTSGAIPDDIDILIVGKAGKLDDKGLFALDQFLMRGGAVIAMAGRYKIDFQQQQGLNAVKDDGNLFALLESWGVNVADGMVLDGQNASFPIPVRERRGNLVFNRVEMIPYPFFPDVRQDGFDSNHPAIGGIGNVTMPWSSPLQVSAGEGFEFQTVVKSSADSWVATDGKINPDLDKYPGVGFSKADERQAQNLVVTVAGPFTSHFADKPSPVWGGEIKDQTAEADLTGRTLKQALPGARLAVIGTSELASDFMLRMPNMMSGEVHRNNVQLIQNLADWTVEDTDLLQIRSSGAFARTLRPLEDDERTMYEYGNYALVVVFIGLVFFIPRRRRESVRPISLKGAA